MTLLFRYKAKHIPNIQHLREYHQRLVLLFEHESSYVISPCFLKKRNIGNQYHSILQTTHIKHCLHDLLRALHRGCYVSYQMSFS